MATNVANQNVGISDSSLDHEAHKVGERLSKCPKKTIKIPIDPLNPKEVAIPVIIDGYRFDIKKGVEVELPLPVIEILEKAGKY
jgi:hypothetical protein